MKINWKQLASTSGYKSLKAAYISDVQKANRSRQRGHRPMRDKAEFREHFNWVICRAIHYAHQSETTVAVVLDKWEEQRNMWWFGFYQESCQCKKHTGQLKPQGRKGLIKYCKTNQGRFGRDATEAKKHTLSSLVRFDQCSSKKNRWNTSRKKAARDLRNWSL